MRKISAEYFKYKPYELSSCHEGHEIAEYNQRYVLPKQVLHTWETSVD